MTDKKSATSQDVFAVLPLRDIVVFPHMIVPLFVGREKSIAALEEVMREDKRILLVAQKNASDDDPTPEQMYDIGTVGSILQLLKLPDGTVKVLVEGLERAQVEEYTDRDEFFEARASIMPVTDEDGEETEALARTAVTQFESYVKLNKKVPQEAVASITQIEDFAKLADSIAAHLAIKISEKQELLETASVARRLEKVYGLMEGEISVLQVEKRIRSRVKRQMEKTQREYYLNEQMKAIQKELGDGDDNDEMAQLEERIRKTKLTKEAREKANAEFKKLKQMSPMSAEATVVRNYLDWLLSIPWGKKSGEERSAARREGAGVITSAWRRSRSASSSISRCRRAPTSCAGRSCASSARPASARPRWPVPLPRRQAANTCACRWAVCVTRPKSAVTGAPTSARCPARSSSR
jgi:ATP-dependent Lon protease